MTYEMNQPNSVWPEFEDLMRKNWLCESGKSMKAHITIVDTGYFTRLAQSFIDSINNCVIFGIKGRIETNYRIISKDTPIISRSREGRKLYLLQVNQIKDIVSENMKLREGQDESQPVGFMNFPQSKDGKYNLKNYFSHFEGEKRTEVLQNEEVIGYTWEKKTSSSLNHFWDVHIYNIAAREIYLDFLKQMDPKIKSLTWSDFIQMVTG